MMFAYATYQFRCMQRHYSQSEQTQTCATARGRAEWYSLLTTQLQPHAKQLAIPHHNITFDEVYASGTIDLSVSITKRNFTSPASIRSTALFT